LIGGGGPARLRFRTGPFARALTRLVGAEALTLGTRVFLSRTATREITAETEAGRRLLRHELVHVSQFARDGSARFLWRYAASYARSRRGGLSHGAAYLEIPYEREARAAETQAGSDA
jgi:Domain of unknown function (DUF4157)